MPTSTSRRDKPAARIECGGCDATWTGVTRCHCSGCHHTLSGLGLFDAHRRAGRCLDPATMTDSGEPLRLVDGIWRGPAWNPGDTFEGSDAA